MGVPSMFTPMEVFSTRAKESTRQEIERLTEEYLARGGVIEKIASTEHSNAIFFNNSIIPAHKIEPEKKGPTAKETNSFFYREAAEAAQRKRSAEAKQKKIQAVQLWKGGCLMIEIGRRIGKSKETVKGYLRNAGIDTSEDKYKRGRARLEKIMSEGKSFDEAVRIMGVSEWFAKQCRGYEPK